MKLTNVHCPLCGILNTGLDLRESRGWMECIHCGKDTKIDDDPRQEAEAIIVPALPVLMVSA